MSKYTPTDPRVAWASLYPPVWRDAPAPPLMPTEAEIAAQRKRRGATVAEWLEAMKQTGGGK